MKKKTKGNHRNVAISTNEAPHITRVEALNESSPPQICKLYMNYLQAN